MSPTASPDADQERELVNRAKNGDTHALGALLSTHGPRLFRSVLLPRLGTSARAYDALGTTYQRVIEHLASYEWHPCGFYPWLRIIALRIALDMIRASKREVLFTTDSITAEIESAHAALLSHDSSYDVLQDRHDAEVARQRVHDALERINPRYAQAIRLRILEERSRDDVASMMAISTSTFDVLLHRSITALKKALLEQDDPGRKTS